MFSKRKLSLAGMVIVPILFSTGCNTQPYHPNQLNAFDGATYNSLTLAHAALVSLRAEISGNFPQYKPAFNEASAGYAAAFQAYSVFRSQPEGKAALAVALGNLTVNIIGLENAFVADLHANPQAAVTIRHKATGVRARFGRNVTVSDILTELEIAAAIAKTVPAAEPYFPIASIVIEATSQALSAEKATAGQPIDLSAIQPLAPIQ
ncbi:MAG TPA: hypothetical protein VH640_05565 [Bryobacteraceae bacterium]